MSFTVPEDVKKRTTKCHHDYSCLESGLCCDKPRCDVKEDTSGVLFLKSKGLLGCPYFGDYGGAKYCACPTHTAIVKKYGRKPNG